MKTISKKYLGLFMLIALVLFNACKKEDDSPNSNNNNGNNNTNIVLDFFNDNLNDAKQVTSIDITTGAYIYGNYGTYIYISDCSFLDSDGNQVTGIIEFELIEAQTKLDMLKLNRPTFTSDGQLLVSGGILYVNARQNGQDLTINPDCRLTANMPNNTNNGQDGIMQYFSGDVDIDGVFGWDLEEEDTVVTGQVVWGDIGFGFDFQIDSVGWINCDYFYSTQSELTGVEVELPNGYDGSNSQCFIYYNSINSLAGLGDGDQDGIFTLGALYSTPVGMDVKFIAISGDTISNDYYYHITGNTTVTLNHFETVLIMDGPITHSDLEIILNTNL
jgi:hypothetical protein